MAFNGQEKCRFHTQIFKKKSLPTVGGGKHNDAHIQTYLQTPSATIKLYTICLAGLAFKINVTTYPGLGVSCYIFVYLAYYVISLKKMYGRISEFLLILIG